MIKKAVFPGSFDPFTNGHMHIAYKALAIFDELYIALGLNLNKKRFLTKEEAMECLYEVKTHLEDKFQKKVIVESFEVFLADYAASRGISFVVRGVRDIIDFEHENKAASYNLYLSGGSLETIFIPSVSELKFVSSSNIKELIKYGRGFKEFLPTEVYKIILQKLANTT